MSTRKHWLALLGFVTGFCSAFLGVGGGFIIVPVLVTYFGCRMKSAIPTSLAAILPITIAGVIAHYFFDRTNIQLFVVVIVIAGAMVGSFIGVKLMYKFSHLTLLKIFSVFLLIVGLQMVALHKLVPFFRTQQYTIAFGVALVALGFIVGIASGFFGIAGGTVLVPVLVTIVGLEYHQAVSTSLAAAIPIVLFSFIFHHKKGRTDMNVVKIIVPCALIGVLFGVFASLKIENKVLVVVFGLFLMAYAARIFMQSIKKEALLGFE